MRRGLSSRRRRGGTLETSQEQPSARYSGRRPSACREVARPYSLFSLLADGWRQLANEIASGGRRERVGKERNAYLMLNFVGSSLARSLPAASLRWPLSVRSFLDARLFAADIIAVCAPCARAHIAPRDSFLRTGTEPSRAEPTRLRGKKCPGRKSLEESFHSTQKNKTNEMLWAIGRFLWHLRKLMKCCLPL